MATIRKGAGPGRQPLLGRSHTDKIDRMRNPQAMRGGLCHLALAFSVVFDLFG